MLDIVKRLSNLPDPLRLSLSYLLVLRALWEQVDNGSSEIEDITAQIERLRASFTAHPTGA